MTEKRCKFELKRFTLIKNTGTDECILDNIYDNGVYIGAISSDVSETICYLLNNLHEENIKQQTQVKKVLKKQLDYYTERVLLLNQPYGDVTEAIHNIADELGVDLE